MARSGTSSALKTKEGLILEIYIAWDMWTLKRYFQIQFPKKKLLVHMVGDYGLILVPNTVSQAFLPLFQVPLLTLSYAVIT